MRTVTELVHVETAGEVIDATPTHPFYVEGYGFKAAGKLKAGDMLLLLDGTCSEVKHIETEHLSRPVRVYNFEVEDWHTYYVTGKGVLVHNTCWEMPGEGGSRTRWGKEHGRGNVKHNNAIEAELDKAYLDGATDIRKNRVQRDVNGKRVYSSDGRYTQPDASYVLNGKRYNTNYISNYTLDNVDELNRELEAFQRMVEADPDAINRLVFQY